MKTILVLGISGNVSLGILRVLKKNFPSYKIIGACVKESFGNYFCDEFVISPFASDKTFLNWIVSICQDKKIDLIFSGVEEVIEVLVSFESFILANTDCKLTFSKYSSLSIGKCKFKTSEWLKNNNFSYPNFFIPNNLEEIENRFKLFRKPLIIKPLVGKGSQDIYKIESLKDFDFVNSSVKNYSNYLVQDLIGNDDCEYTIGCYQNIFGDVIKPIVFRRKLSNGNTVYAELIENECITDYAVNITKSFNPMGPLNVQLRLDNDGNPVCFELNVRFSGTSLIRDYFGFKDVVSLVGEKLFNEFSHSNFVISPNGICFRAANEFFLDDRNGVKQFFHYE